MCGIFCAVSNENVAPICLEGLKKLEYRGYDSAGIGFFNNGNIETKKKMGYVEQLSKEVVESKTFCNCAISHTRWATHGAVCEKNCHPILSSNGLVAVVHNGIIENYFRLKSELFLGKVFSTETDTEIISNLLEKFICEGKTEIEAMNELSKILVGNYAICALFKNSENKIYFCKHSSPLVVGKNSTTNFVCSDVFCLNGVADEFYDLKNNELGCVEKSSITIWNSEFQKLEIKFEPISGNVLKDFSENGFNMMREIQEEKQAISNTILNNSFQVLNECFSKLGEFENIYIIGCGTAFHAGLIGADLFQENGFNVICQVASEFKYAKTPIKKNSIAFFISQSGETADTNACLIRCKENGVVCVAITNVQNSLITKNADINIFTYAGKEFAVASTKAYMCQVAILMQICKFFEGKIKNKFSIFQEYISGVLNLCNQLNNQKVRENCEKLAKKYVNFSNFYLIGRRLDYLLACESALKIKEITYKHCEAYPAGELKHGTIAQITSGSVVIAFATEKDILQKTISNVNEVKTRGGKIVLIIPEKFLKFIDKTITDDVIVLENNQTDCYIFQAIENMQLFAFYMSVLLGNNPDKPRNLAKSVTVE